MVYIYLANGFEEIEALCPLDLLRRAKVEVKTVGIGSKTITGSHGITIETDMVDGDFDDKNPTMIILPGGMPGTKNLEASDIVIRAIQNQANNDMWIAAICAAPSILGKMHLLEGKEAICYPGFESQLYGAKISRKRVVADGKIVTAAGMGVALEFGLKLVEILKGKETAEQLRKAVIAD